MESTYTASMTDQLIPCETQKWIEHLRSKYCIQGLALTVVKGNNPANMQSQTLTLGQADSKGNPVEPDVSLYYKYASGTHTSVVIRNTLQY